MNSRQAIFDEHALREAVASVQHSQDPHSSRAAVLIGVQRGPAPSVILTQRAAHMKAHAGEVAFPGGKRDDSDPSVAHTALREAEEEIALPVNAVDVVGHMPQITTRFGVTVTPVVGLVEERVPLQANADEIAEIFTVPLHWLCQQQNLRVDHYRTEQGDRFYPYFLYEGFRIWGATSIMLTGFLNHVFNAGLVVDPARADNIRS
jgi:8-oxo-dGTP pyrophosphatase MutT (NUDIX family)